MMMVRIIAIILIGFILVACMAQQHNSEAAILNARLGRAYFNRGQVARAKSKFLLALQQDASNPLVVCAFADFLDHTGETKLAKRYYLYAIAVDENSGAAHNNYGVFLCRHGYYKKAIAEFMLAAHNLSYLHTASAYRNAELCAAKKSESKGRL